MRTFTRRVSAAARMRQMSRFAWVAVGLALILGGTASVRLVAQSPAKPKYPEIGLWKQNIEKSKYMTGQPPRMSVRKYETSADGFVTLTIVGVDAQGNPQFNFIRFRYDDGKDYPRYTNAALARMVATGAKPGTSTYKILDGSTAEFTQKDNTGKITGIITRTVSTDGKTLTLTVKDASGKIMGVEVYDKQ
jgi:hypothetical protein